jgi:nicotinate-nucleotide pyrophosphorylase (carboxylating)
LSFSLEHFDLDAFVRATLAEDLGPSGRDVTSESVIPAEARFSGVMDSRDAIVVAGLPIAEAFFRHLDPDVEIELLSKDGETVGKGTDLMRLTGKARAMLTAERSALNTVQHLSGIATMTQSYVKAIAGTGCTLLDTRKTIPGLRVLEKYAVRMGGGQNHRMGLWDAAMIKDNHVAVAGGVAEAVMRARDAGRGADHFGSGPDRTDRAGAGSGCDASAARQYGAGHAARGRRAGGGPRAD